MAHVAVSILVLLDEFLEVLTGHPDLAVFLFQSLFSWMNFSKQQAPDIIQAN